MQGLHRRLLPCGGVGTDSGPLPELWRERPDLYDYSLRGARLLMPTWGCESAPGGAGKVRADRIQRGCRALLRLGPTHTCRASPSRNTVTDLHSLAGCRGVGIKDPLLASSPFAMVATKSTMKATPSIYQPLHPVTGV